MKADFTIMRMRLIKSYNNLVSYLAENKEKYVEIEGGDILVEYMERLFAPIAILASSSSEEGGEKFDSVNDDTKILSLEALTSKDYVNYDDDYE